MEKESVQKESKVSCLERWGQYCWGQGGWGVCVQCGERGVGGLLEERGCVMSTCILPNSLGLSHAHQPIPLMACLKELS